MVDESTRRLKSVVVDTRCTAGLLPFPGGRARRAADALKFDYVGVGGGAGAVVVTALNSTGTVKRSVAEVARDHAVEAGVRASRLDAARRDDEGKSLGSG